MPVGLYTFGKITVNAPILQDIIKIYNVQNQPVNVSAYFVVSPTRK